MILTSGEDIFEVGRPHKVLWELALKWENNPSKPEFLPLCLLKLCTNLYSEHYFTIKLSRQVPFKSEKPCNSSPWNLQLIMVIGLSGFQFGLLSYDWWTKSDVHYAGVWFVNHKVLLPINLNCYNFCKKKNNLEQISLMDTMPTDKNSSILEIPQFFSGWVVVAMVTVINSVV